ncbi:MAG: FHA domain-containing protein [Planctomycetaceae bacterium]
MSLPRLVYYSAMIGGWAAFIGWFFSEMFFQSDSIGGTVQVALVGGLVGAAIGAGLNMVAGMSNGQWKQLLLRIWPGLIGGGLGGLLGGLAGNILFIVGVPKALGWCLMGLGIGVVEGLYERSPGKLRNGLIGGGLGGLFGGMLFDPITNMIGSASGMSSRATSFVILGMCIGVLIGLAQVVLKDAWLTVLDGYRAGRQLILSQPVTTLGRAEHLPLPFLGSMSQDLELEHARLTRQPNGSFALADNQSRIGTRLNGQPVQSAVVLKDGDVIKLGTNFIRFNERQRKAGAESSVPASGFSGKVVAAPPPPPGSAKPSVAAKPVAPLPAVISAPPPPAMPKAEPMPTPAPAPPRPAAPNLVPPPPPRSSAPVGASSPPPPKMPPPPPPKPIAPPPPPGGGGAQTIRPIIAPPPPPPRKP